MEKWTFTVITQSPNYLPAIIQSIENECPDGQLIVVGGEKTWRTELDHVHIPFDESEKPGWITRKKNLSLKWAKYDNLCIMHDYVALEPGWLEGFEKYGYDWLTCMTKVFNADGERYRDWCLIYNDAWKPPIDDQKPPAQGGKLLDYTDYTHGRWQYYSGAYFCVKREVLLEVPLDESLVQGAGEDVYWSRCLYKHFGSSVFRMNFHSAVKLLKYKNRVWS